MARQVIALAFIFIALVGAVSAADAPAQSPESTPAKKTTTNEAPPPTTTKKSTATVESPKTSSSEENDEKSPAPSVSAPPPSDVASPPLPFTAEQPAAAPVADEENGAVRLNCGVAAVVGVAGFFLF